MRAWQRAMFRLAGRDLESCTQKYPQRRHCGGWAEQSVFESNSINKVIVKLFHCAGSLQKLFAGHPLVVSQVPFSY